MPTGRAIANCDFRWPFTPQNPSKGGCMHKDMSATPRRRDTDVPVSRRSSFSMVDCRPRRPVSAPIPGGRRGGFIPLVQVSPTGSPEQEAKCVKVDRLKAPAGHSVEAPNYMSFTVDGSLDWDAWLALRLTPAGPLALVETLSGAAMEGNIDQLSAAVMRAEAHGPAFIMSLEQTPTPWEAQGCKSIGSTSARNLWSWAKERLSELQKVEQECAAAIITAKSVMSRSRLVIPPELSPEQNTNEKVNARQNSQRCSTVATDVINFNVIIAEAQGNLNKVSQKLEKLLLQDHSGLKGHTANEAKRKLHDLHAEQQALFSRFLKWRAHIEKELSDATTTQLSTASRLRLKKAIIAALGELGINSLVGMEALQSATEAGLRTANRDDHRQFDPWAALTPTPPPWEDTFQDAVSRYVQLNAVLEARGALHDATSAASSGSGRAYGSRDPYLSNNRRGGHDKRLSGYGASVETRNQSENENKV